MHRLACLLFGKDSNLSGILENHISPMPRLNYQTPATTRRIKISPKEGDMTKCVNNAIWSGEENDSPNHRRFMSLVYGIYGIVSYGFLMFFCGYTCFQRDYRLVVVYTAYRYSSASLLHWIPSADEWRRKNWDLHSGLTFEDVHSLTFQHSPWKAMVGRCNFPIFRGTLLVLGRVSPIEDLPEDFPIVPAVHASRIGIRLGSW